MSGLVTTKSLPSDENEMILQQLKVIHDIALKNLVLGSLSDITRDQLLEEAKCIELRKGTVLLEQGQVSNSVYFPTSGLLIGIHEAHDGTSIGNTVRGREGAVGAIPTARTLHPKRTGAMGRLVVQLPGEAIVISKSHFAKILNDSFELLRVTLAHAANVIKWHEETQNCSRHHRIENRIAYWLSVLFFYSGDDSIPTTHAAIAEVLGVRRESVSMALRKFEEREFIKMERSKLQLLSPELMRNYSCECETTISDLAALHAAGQLTLDTKLIGSF